MQPVHPHAVGQIVVVDVAGLGDGVAQVDQAVAGLLPVAVLVLAPRQAEEAGAEGLAGDVGDPGLQSAQADEGFHRGAWRVLAAQGTVEQGLLLRLLQRPVLLRRDPFHEQVGVVTRLAHQRQHLAVAWVDGDGAAGVVAECLHGGGLQAGVEGEIEIAARLRRLALQHPDHPSEGVHLHLLQPHLAMQHLLVGLLDPVLADVAGARIGGGVDGLQLLLVDASDIADHVGGHRPQGVVAQQFGLDLDTGKAVAADRQPRHLVRVQADADGDAVEAAFLFAQSLEAAPIAVTDLHDPADSGQGLLHVLHPFRGHLQAVGGQVLGQDGAVAVVDQATGGR